MTTTTPQSLSASRMVVSLNEMNNIQENWLTALRNHVPGVVMLLLIAVAMVATGFAGYHAAARGSHSRVVTFIMSLTIASVIMLVLDLDRPARGVIQVTVQPLIATPLQILWCGRPFSSRLPAPRMRHSFPTGFPAGASISAWIVPSAVGIRWQEASRRPCS